MRKPRRDALTRVRHDLRSLVHSVVGYSDLLASARYGTLSAEQARFLDHVRTAADQLQELVDTCIELSRPLDETCALEPMRIPLGAALKHVQAGLAGESIRCTLSVQAPAEALECALELPVLMRALRSIALVISHEGTLPCTLSAAQDAHRVVIGLCGPEDPHRTIAWSRLDALEDDVGNRDFVRLKLGEVLLARYGIGLKLTAELDQCELTLG
jgi:light-regulated signal transduction histidine kinase (bacteriophytochrome)